MSIEAVRQFNFIAESNPEIRQSLETTTDSQWLMNLIVELGDEKGFSFTINDIKQYYEEESRSHKGSKASVMFLTRSFNEIESDPRICDGLPFLARQICLKLNS